MNKKYKILVIEDDTVLSSNICQLLDSEGYEVEYAENGKIGIEKAKSIHPDLILSDIMMPEADGYQVLEELMKSPETAIIPFIFLTAKNDIGSFRKGMSLGAEDYLFKPFSLDSLLQAIEVRLKKKEMNEYVIEKTKHDIFSKIHHDLRTPLVPIIGYSDMIEKENDIEQIKSMVKVIKQSGKKLFDRIEKFLIYNELDYKSSNKKLTDGQTTEITLDLVNRIILGMSNSLNAVERCCVTTIPAKLKMGSWCLQVLLKEIIENALKYSPLEKSVLINGFISEGYYQLSITDFGRGLSQKEINSISPFNKFGHNKIAEPGVGIGLAVVKKITEIYNIEFNIISSPNQKTVCEFKIPPEG